MPRERRWIIVAEDGRHVTVGRETDPTEEEVEKSSEQLSTLGLEGLLAVLEGSYYKEDAKISLLMVRGFTLFADPGAWQKAEAAFRGLRSMALAAT